MRVDDWLDVVVLAAVSCVCVGCTPPSPPARTTGGSDVTTPETPLVLQEPAPSSKELTGRSQETNTNAPAKEAPPAKETAPAKEAEYRSIDPEKDGFTIELSSGGEIRYGADGWMSGGPVTLTAIGTAQAVSGAKLVLLESGKCVGGKAETKDYGIVKMKAAGRFFSANFLMTQETITKVRHALDGVAKK